MKNLYCILFISILYCNFSFGQTTKIDSLKSIWTDITKSDSVRFERGLDIFKLQFRKNLDSARSTGKELLNFAIKKNNKNWQATSHRFIGNSYAVQGNYSEALKSFTNSYYILDELSDEKSMAATLNNIGTVHYELGNYPQALTNMLDGMKLSEKLNDKVGLARVTNNLGNVYTRQNNNLKALEYYTRSLKIKKELGNKNTIAFAYNNIGLAHNNLKNYKLAIENLQKSADAAEIVEDKRSLSRAYSNLGDVFLRKADYTSALKYLNKSLIIKNEINDEEGLGSVYLYKGQTYLEQKEYLLAIDNCKKSLNLSTKIGALLEKKHACTCLSSAWEKLGNTNKALHYYKLSISAKDSLFNKEKTQEITRQEMLYQFDKKQLADSISYHKEKAQQQLTFERNLSNQKSKFNFIVFGGLGLLLIGGIFWRSRQKSIKLESERNNVNRLLEVDKLKDEFLANTSHELRTPLTGIIGLTESLKDGIAGKLPSIAIENLDLIANSGKRLTHLVNDILDFSKLKNKDLVLNLNPVDIHSLVDIVLRLSKPLISSKNVELINSISDNISMVNADENRLQQIFYNLIGNAIKFTEKGSIEVSAKEVNNKIEVTVSDTGIGIPKEKYDSVFKAFEQGDGSIVREQSGTGLGLTVTKQLIELHGGSIRFESALKKGTSFIFTLNKSTSKRVDLQNLTFTSDQQLQKIQETPIYEENVTKVINKANAPKILIVDDEQINRKVLENHLSLAGYRLKEASDGKEALSLIKQGFNFDLILLDIMMPGVSGYEVCERIRKKYGSSELPIILLTAKNRVSDLVTGFNAGANDYLTKPFSRNELLSRIKTHINLKNIHNATSKFIPTEFLKSIDKETLTDVALGDHSEKEVTVLFTDIRDYTPLSETMTPEQNFKFVNAYVSRMGPLIQQNRGFVNQYLGDGIMALFPHRPHHAIQAAIDMQRKIRTYNKKRIANGYKPIYVGMGLHTGSLIMGIIGDIKRNDTAIIADTVNTASRMEGLTKHYGANIIISGKSLEIIENKEQYNLRYLGKVQAKGKDKIVDIYECFDGDNEQQIMLKKQTLQDYNNGLSLFFSKDFSKAQKVFNKILENNNEDTVVTFFLNKTKIYSKEDPQDWEGVNIMNKK